MVGCIRCRWVSKYGSIRSVRSHRRVLIAVLGLLAANLLSACEEELDERRFARRAERAYAEVHPGWTIIGRAEGVTTFAQGDQLEALPVAELYRSYRASEQSASTFFSTWKAQRREKAEARRRTLDAAAADVIPIIKGGDWIRVQDLGTVATTEEPDYIRPWRQQVADDVYVVLGVPEGVLGYRIPSIDEVITSTRSEHEWVDAAIDNLLDTVGEVDAEATYSSLETGRLVSYELDDIDGVSALVLDPRFRRRMLDLFDRPELGAAAPIRNALIVFDLESYAVVRRIRSRAYDRYDTENHPGFRGLLRFDRDMISVIEPNGPRSAGP